MNEIQKSISSIIKGYALFCTFLAIAFTELCFADMSPYDYEVRYDIPAFIAIACLIFSSIGLYLYYQSVKSFGANLDRVGKEAANHLQFCALFNILNLPWFIIIILEICQIEVSYLGRALYPYVLMTIITVSTIIGFWGYIALCKSKSLNQKGKMGAKTLIISQMLYVIFFAIVVSAEFISYRHRHTALSISCVLYIIHWVLFFAGWSKVRASFAETPNTQRVTANQSAVL